MLKKSIIICTLLGIIMLGIGVGLNLYQVEPSIEEKTESKVKFLFTACFGYEFLEFQLIDDNSFKIKMKNDSELKLENTNAIIIFYNQKQKMIDNIQIVLPALEVGEVKEEVYTYDSKSLPKQYSVAVEEVTDAPATG